jgi:hypothetical protein
MSVKLGYSVKMADGIVPKMPHFDTPMLSKAGEKDSNQERSVNILTDSMLLFKRQKTHEQRKQNCDSRTKRTLFGYIQMESKLLQRHSNQREIDPSNTSAARDWLYFTQNQKK